MGRVKKGLTSSEFRPKSKEVGNQTDVFSSQIPIVTTLNRITLNTV